VPDVDVGFDQPRHDVGHFVGRERGADHLAERRMLALRPADRHLVPLGAVLVDTQDADVPDVMVAARVHAAGNVEIELADVVQIVEVVETALDRLGDGDRLGIRQRAEIATADDVVEADVRRREAQSFELLLQRLNPIVDVGEHRFRSCDTRSSPKLSGGQRHGVH
jgi:hypothetical protein